MKKFHLVKIRFDRRRADITPEWLEARSRFFLEHTYRSLQGQTFKAWRLWINTDNQATLDMLGTLRRELPTDTLFTAGDESPYRYMARQDQLRVTDADMVYVTRLDSDDLFSSDALALANACEPTERYRPEASLFRRGYMLELETGRLGTYYNPSPPFHTLMIPAKMFADPAGYQAVFQVTGDHSRVGAALPCHALPDWKFCVTIHGGQGGNFLSTWNYGQDKEAALPVQWSLEKWLAQPVVFDVDDLCDQWNCLPELMALRERFPKFKATCFTIPGRTSKALLQKAHSLGFLELAVHGFEHEPLDEVLRISESEMTSRLAALDYSVWAKVFRPPGWHLRTELINACNTTGLAMAVHERDRKYAARFQHGFYICGDRLPYRHQHSHNVCQNWLKADLPRLLTAWPEDQEFAFVSEAIVKKR